MFIIGVLVSVAGLWWASSGVRWRDLGGAFTNPRLYLYAVPFVVVTMGTMWVRSIRSYFLLRHESRLGQWPLFKITMIGFAYNSILPARAGEFARAYLLGRERGVDGAPGIGLVKGAASLLVERIYDLIAILACLAAAMLFVQITPDATVDLGIGEKGQIEGSQVAVVARGLGYMGIVLVAGVVFMLFERARALVFAAIEKTPGLTRGIKDRLRNIVVSFSSGLASVKRPSTVVAVVVLTFLIWLSVAFTVWLLQFGFDGLEPISLSDGFVITVIICFAVVLPSGPAYFGMYEAGGVLALLILGKSTDRSLALSFVLALHLLQIIPLIVFGLWFAAIDHFSIKNVKEQEA